MFYNLTCSPSSVAAVSSKMSFDSISSWECFWVLYSVFSCCILCIVLYAILKARLGRSNSLFSGPFFTICLIQGTHEILMFLTTNLINRPRKYRLIQYPLNEHSSIIEWEQYWFIFIRNNLYLGHLLVAVNRLSAFFVKNMTTYDRIWSTRNILLVTLCSYLINIILRIIEYSPSDRYIAYVDNTTDIFSFKMPPFVQLFDAICEISLSVGTAIICCVCYVIASLMARRSGILKQQYKKQEVMLLRVGIFTFFTFIPTAIRSILSLVAMATNDSNLATVTSRAASMCIEVIFVFQCWLLLIACPSLREHVLTLLHVSYRLTTSISNSSEARTTNHSVTIIT